MDFVLGFTHDKIELAGLRMLRISKFEKYLIFYRPVPEGTEIIRVLHGARDIHPSLGRQQQEAVRSKKPLSPRFALVSKNEGVCVSLERRRLGGLLFL